MSMSEINLKFSPAVLCLTQLMLARESKLNSFWGEPRLPSLASHPLLSNDAFPPQSLFLCFRRVATAACFRVVFARYIFSRLGLAAVWVLETEACLWYTEHDLDPLKIQPNDSLSAEELSPLARVISISRSISWS